MELTEGGLIEFGRLYYIAYWCIICFFTLILIFSINKQSLWLNKFYAPIVCGIIILFITFRPLVWQYFGDSLNYALAYENIPYRDFNEEAKDIGFEWLMFKLNQYSLGYQSLFFIFALVYAGCQLLAVKRLFPKYTAVAFILIIGSFSFFGYGFNGMRNGAACSLVLLAFTERKLLIQILLCLIGFSFHASVLLPIGAYFIAKFYKNLNVYICIWILCVIVNWIYPNLLGGMDFIEDMFDDSRISYFSSTFDDLESHVSFSNTGFRWDFVFFSAIPIFLGYYTVKKIIKSNLKVNNMYIILLNIYIVCNSAWLFTAHLPFNNRFAYLSWFLFPILLLYPFILNPTLRTNKAINLLLIGNLSVTFLLS